MKKLELKNDDFLGYVKHLRHACRGIVVHESKVLLGYEEKITSILFLVVALKMAKLMSSVVSGNFWKKPECRFGQKKNIWKLENSF